MTDISGSISSGINLGRNSGTSLGSYFGGALITWLGTAAILPYFNAAFATSTLILFMIQWMLLKRFQKIKLLHDHEFGTEKATLCVKITETKQ